MTDTKTRPSDALLERRIAFHRKSLENEIRDLHRAWNLYSYILDDFLEKFQDHPAVQSANIGLGGLYGASINVSVKSIFIAADMVRFLTSRGLQIKETPAAGADSKTWRFAPRKKGFIAFNDMLSLHVYGMKCERIVTTTVKEVEEVTYVCE